MGSKLCLAIHKSVARSTQPSIHTKYGNICIPLTKKDIKKLRESWGIMKMNWYKICLVVFDRWFSMYPELRNMFKSFSSVLTLQELLASRTMKSHIQQLEELVEDLLYKVDDPTDFIETVIQFGEGHHKLGAKQLYATSLAAAFQYAICISLNLDRDTENAWDSLFRFLMDCLKFGMRNEMHKETTSPLDKLEVQDG